jgi:MFS family permease
MMTDLGFSEAVYGFGAGIVHLGYALFKIPSNLFLERIGARKTFARITILWGITSIATMFVKTATSFYVLRFLLGSFEAGCPTFAVSGSSSKARCDSRSDSGLR